MENPLWHLTPPLYGFSDLNYDYILLQSSKIQLNWIISSASINTIYTSLDYGRGCFSLYIYFLYCCQLEIWAGCLYHHCPYWCLPFLWNVLHVCKTSQTPRFTEVCTTNQERSLRVLRGLFFEEKSLYGIQRMLRNWLEIFFTRQNATVA